MTAPTIITSADSGVPVLTGVYASLINLFDYALVTRLGWTKEFTGANKAVYRANPSGKDPILLRIDDSEANGKGSIYANTNCYESMADIDNGTGLWHSGYIKKASNANTTPVPWIIIGDSYGFYLFTLTNHDGRTNNTHYGSYYFGEYKNILVDNAWNAIACDGFWTNSGDYRRYPQTFNVDGSALYNNELNNTLHRKPSGDLGTLGVKRPAMVNSNMVKGVDKTKLLAPSCNTIPTAYNYPYRGKLILAQMVLIDDDGCIMGSFPNAYAAMHGNLSTPQNITVDGITYMVIPILMGWYPLGGDGSVGAVVVDITSDFRA